MTSEYDERSESTLVSGITNAVSGVPESLRKPFFKACSVLVAGVVGIPAAKPHQDAQAIKDTTTLARLQSVQALAGVVAESISIEPGILTNATETFLPVNIRKPRNKRVVVTVAAAHFPNAKTGEDLADAELPNYDGMNFFMRFAEDASSERMCEYF